MFSSGGYFRGFNCPFFASGLCERPYCHYRHVKTEEEKPQSKAAAGYSDAQYEVNWNPGKNSSGSLGEHVKLNKYTGEPEISIDPKTADKETPPEEFENVNKYTGEPILTPETNEYIVEVKTNCQNYKPTDKKSLKSRRPKLNIPKPVQKVNKYTGEPVVESVEKQAYTPEARDFPEYNPTPINQLKPSPPKYKTDILDNENEQEYDPQSNFSTTSLLKPSQPLAIKRSFTYDPTTPDFHHPAKKAKEEQEVPVSDNEDKSDDGELGMFSEDEEEMISESREDDVDTIDNEEENSSKPSMITDVKVFESLLMPVMDHDDSNDRLSDTEKTLSDSKKKFNEKTKHAKKSKTSDKTSDHSKKSSNSSIQRNGHSSKEKVSKAESSKSSKSSSSSKSREQSSSKPSSSKSSVNGPKNSSDKQSSSHSSSSDKTPHKHSSCKSSSTSSSSSSKNKSSEKESSKKPSSSSSSHQNHEHSKQSSHSKSKHETNTSKHEKSSSKTEKSSVKHEHHKHSSDTTSKHDHKKHDSVSKSSKEGHRNSTEKERKKRDRSVSLDSNGSRRKIVNLNVDLFGEDSDGGPSLFSDEEEDPYEECLRIYNESNVSRPSPKKQHNEMKLNDADQSESMQIPGKKRTAHIGSKEVTRKIPKKPNSKLSPAQIMHNRFVQMQKQAQEEAGRSQEPSTSSASHSKQRVAHHSKQAGQGTKIVDGKTVITTVSKTQKRTAHVPNVKNLKRPTIPAEYGSKVPISVRQRYLNTIIDECLPLYQKEEDAFKRGLEEELSVYKRASNKNVYLNVACNTIKRLRTETAEFCSSPTKPTSPQKMSHEAMLGGKNATKTTYTLNRSGGSYRGPMENFKGSELCNRLSRYILTEEQLQENGYPRPDPENSSAAKVYTTSQQEQNSAKLKTYEKICVRCGKRFMVYPNGTYAHKEECIHHWGKAWKKKIAGYIETRYTCCQGDLGAEGCQVAKYHVHESNKWENRMGYLRTFPCSPVPDGDYGVYAMDCEMVYTQGGQELARVTVTDCENNSVYETLVRPDRKVIDYNTRFSGITAEDMDGVTTTIRDVQAVLLSLFTEKTILIGHSLESDLVAVKIIHDTVVDTAVVFPHRLGPPYKRALKTLMAEYLKKIIQDDVGGHDSQEDAISCMELMQWRVKEDARKEPRCS
ncbi:RNA exonuclease 1 homolog isoform X1 [Crassostrea angulata]|uniref:RNA exonuclease 1 homolog isoform X1 n=1 Tax=Magallana angulata TaxID=2784310 RepID=UPI0022B1A0BE|nr:RNA exonuclease 1 homolog isoform X1 [Crassostrea angulata]